MPAARVRATGLPTGHVTAPSIGWPTGRVTAPSIGWPTWPATLAEMPTGIAPLTWFVRRARCAATASTMIAMVWPTAWIRFARTSQAASIASRNSARTGSMTTATDLSTARILPASATPPVSCWATKSATTTWTTTTTAWWTARIPTARRVPVASSAWARRSATTASTTTAMRWSIAAIPSARTSRLACVPLAAPTWTSAPLPARALR